ncbi:MAG: hypothetical protein ABIK92_21955 [Pseudomonadota bacterium]
MYSWNPERERSGLENALKSENLDFSAAFMVVQDLHQLVQANPAIIRLETISAKTGPHLGGFNQRISVPELIQCIGAVSAYCIGGGYLAKKVLHG